MRKTTLCALCFANVHGLANRLVTLNPEAFTRALKPSGLRERRTINPVTV